MPIINPTAPTIGQPNSTEDPDVVAYLTALKNLVNGGLDNANITALAAIAGSKIADASIPATKHAAGALAMVKIQEITLSATGPILFSSIPQTYKHLRVVGKVKSSRAVSDTGLWVRPNSNAAALYQHVGQTNAGAGTITGAGSSGNPFGFVGTIAAASLGGAAFTGVDFMLPEYFSNTFWKNWDSRTWGQMSGGMKQYIGAGEWQSSNAVTSLLFDDDVGGGLVAGSHMSLYGLN